MKCPHCMKVIQNQNYEKIRIKRLELILDLLEIKDKITPIYIKLKKSFNYSRKTLERDLHILKRENKINIIKKKKKNGGYENFIEKT